MSIALFLTCSATPCRSIALSRLADQVTQRVDQTVGPTDPTPQTAVLQAGQAAGSSSDRVPALAWLIAAVFVAVELAVSGRYGFMQDELYFVESSRHLAFGYVDQPPLTPLLTRVAELPGLSPTGIGAAAGRAQWPGAPPGLRQPCCVSARGLL